MTDRRTTRGHGLTLIEVLVMIVILACVIGVLWPALRASREPVRCMQESTRFRDIHQGETFFAQGNNGWYSGFDRDGKLETDHVFEGEPQSTDWNGYDQSIPRAPSWRFRRLLENEYFTGAYCISPSETRQTWYPGESLDPGKFSFAMLKIEGEADSPRKREHRPTDNALAVIISDRAIAHGSGYRSVHTFPADPNAVSWRGSVAWNDNHVTFETSAIVDTQYDAVANANDNLFTDNDPSGQPNAEAAMAWKSAGDTDAELVE